MTSSRAGYVAGLLPVQTFRTNGSGAAVTNYVGGQNPRPAMAETGHEGGPDRSCRGVRHEPLLVACVNDTPTAARRRVLLEGRPVEIPVEAFRSRLVLVERGTGKILAATPGAAIG